VDDEVWPAIGQAVDDDATNTDWSSEPASATCGCRKDTVGGGCAAVNTADTEDGAIDIGGTGAAAETGGTG
jgi:hypothetical protein